MTLKELNEGKGKCKKCGGRRMEFSGPHPTDSTHPGGVRCVRCRDHTWLQKEKNIEKRPTLKPGLRQSIWDAWGNRCVHCGIAEEHLKILGVMRTVQHAPPYCVVKNEGNLLPYCDWCQQDSATAMKQRWALLKRIANPETREALAKLYESLERETP